MQNIAFRFKKSFFLEKNFIIKILTFSLLAFPVRLTLDILALLTGNARTPLEMLALNFKKTSSTSRTQREFLARATAGMREGGKYLSELSL